MTLFFNILPWIIIAATIVAVFKTKYPLQSFVVGVVLFILYTFLQPSYLPKGTVSISELPAFEPSSAVIEDRNSKPVPLDERDKAIREKVKQGLNY